MQTKSPNNMEKNKIDFKFNERVTLIGIYAKNIISKKGVGEHKGHYKLIVNDSIEVFLLPPYHKEAIRSKKEAQSFEGKKVEVTGIIREKTSFSVPSLENQPLTLNKPCFVSIESIQLAK